ncbi:MAG TPA: twin-arginine translocase TatA/TatE family subunit [Candidatus Kapabacteria bacterium]|nr:twin-arginine translocase TatA/TatE family subunit [Candidatus Kapabacteria bacterium]
MRLFEEPFTLLMIIFVVVLLFGGKKIPELMRGLGSGVREFKKAAQGDDEEENKPTEEKKS